MRRVKYRSVAVASSFVLFFAVIFALSLVSLAEASENEGIALLLPSDFVQWNESDAPAIMDKEQTTVLKLASTGEVKYVDVPFEIDGKKVIKVVVKGQAMIDGVKPEQRGDGFCYATLNLQFSDAEGKLLSDYQVGFWSAELVWETVSGKVDVPSDATRGLLVAVVGGGAITLNLKEMGIWGIEGERPPEPGTIDPRVAMTLHQKAWTDIVEKAVGDLDYKCGLYQSRIMTVKHPEIYLQADELFESLMMHPSMENYYLSTPKTRDEQFALDEEFGRKRGRALKWETIDVTRYTSIDYGQLYGKEALLPYLDLRLHIMAAALKGTNWQATPLSMAEFLFFRLKHDRRYKKPYILMAEDGKAYVSAEQGSSRILLKHDGSAIEAPLGKVILVFDTDYVWYPLMSRDDRKESPTLSKVVELYASEGATPELTPFEAELVQELKKATEFADRVEKYWVLFSAAKLHNRSWSTYSSLFRQLYPEDARKGKFNRSHGPDALVCRNSYIARISNRLSPTTALWASAAVTAKGDFNVAMEVISQKFFDRGLTAHESVGIDLWFHSELIMYNVDDFILSNVSMCLMSATNAAAVLDLALFPEVEYWTTMIPGHAYTTVFFGGEAGIFENGAWRYYNGLTPSGDDKYLKGVVLRDGWVVFAEQEDFGIRGIRSNLAKGSVLDILRKIDEKSYSQAIVCTFNRPRKERGMKVHDFLRRVSK